MSTRGLYGFRKNGEDKTTYNHYDSYPNGLGKEVIRFCLNTLESFKHAMCDSIELVSEEDKPSREQIEFCNRYNSSDFTVSSQREDDWYCLLRNVQGDLMALKNIVEHEGKCYMIDNHDFIKDSLFCEWAYIINLDDRVLEIYQGFQERPDPNNRYGCERNRDGYYPCKKALSIPFDVLMKFKDEDEAIASVLKSIDKE